VQKFQLNGIELHIPDDCLTPPLVQKLRHGSYEQNEATALGQHLVAGNRVLDIGAGAGYLSAVAAAVVGGGNVVAIEANPHMMAPLRANLSRNNAGGATVVHGAVVADGFVGDSVKFRSRQAFWASEISPDSAPDGKRISSVPVVQIGALVRAHRPDVVILDIEGGEAVLFDTDWPADVGLLIMEIHTKIYGADVVQRIFDGLSRSGMTYMPWGSRGETVVFQRVAAGQ